MNSGASLGRCRTGRRGTTHGVVLTGLATLMLAGAGCASTHSRSVQEGLDGDRLTVAKVQSEIRKGMSGGEVIEAVLDPR